MKQNNFKEYNQSLYKELSNVDTRLGKLSKAALSMYLSRFDFSIQLATVPFVCLLQDYKYLVAGAEKIFQIQNKLIQYMLATYSRKQILQYFELHPLLERFIDWDKLGVGSNQMARIDIVPCRDKFKFCEINADSSIAGLKIFESYQCFMKKIDFDKPFDWLSPVNKVEQYLRNIIQRENIAAIVVFSLSKYYKEGTATVQHTIDYLKKRFSNLEHHYIDEKSVDKLTSIKKTKKPLIFRIGVFDDITDHAILENILDDRCIVINSFETEILSSKKWFAIFWDDDFRKIITKDECDVIAEFIPRTYQLNVGNFECFLSQKDLFVFKQNTSYGGAGVKFGADFTIDELRKLIADNLKQWSVQEAIQSSSGNEYNVVLGLYRINGEYLGMLLRLHQHSKVVNVTIPQAQIGWAYVMDMEQRSVYLDKLKAINNKQVVTGSCHCQAIQFTINVCNDSMKVIECNCSICSKVGYLHYNIKQADLNLISGRNAIKEYKFNTMKATHFFCIHCGIKPFYIPRSHPHCYSVNIRCLDLDDTFKLHYEKFDGENWEARIADLVRS